MVLYLSFNYSHRLVRSLILIQQYLVLKMVVHKRQDPHNRRLIESELDLVILIVPQVINSIGLPVIEILLLSLWSIKVSGRVESFRKLLDWAVHRLGGLSLELSGLQAGSCGNLELIVGAPLGLSLTARRNLLHQPDSEESLLWHGDNSLVFVVSLFSADYAILLTRRTEQSANLLKTSMSFLRHEIIDLVRVSEVLGLKRVVILVDSIQLSSILKGLNQKVDRVPLMEFLEDAYGNIDITTVSRLANIEFLVSEEGIMRIVN